VNFTVIGHLSPSGGQLGLDRGNASRRQRTGRVVGVEVGDSEQVRGRRQHADDAQRSCPRRQQVRVVVRQAELTQHGRQLFRRKHDSGEVHQEAVSPDERAAVNTHRTAHDDWAHSMGP